MTSTGLSALGSALGHSLRHASLLRLEHSQYRASTVLGLRLAARLPAPIKTPVEQRWLPHQSLPQYLPRSSVTATASALHSQSAPKLWSSRGTAIRGGPAPPPVSGRASSRTTWLVPPLPRQTGGGGEVRPTEGRGKREQRGGNSPGRGGA